MALIRFELLPNIPENESRYEAAIITFAEIIKTATRSEDLCARLGRLEFTMIVKGQIQIAEAIADRVCSNWQEASFFCKASVISTNGSVSSLEILNRLDGAPVRERD